MISRKDFAWGTVKIVSIMLLWDAVYSGLGVFQTILTVVTSGDREFASKALSLIIGGLAKFAVTFALGIYLLTKGDFLVRLIIGAENNNTTDPSSSETV